MLFANTKKLDITYETIIQELEKRQKPGEKKVLIEGAKYDARIVLHLQTPKEGVLRLLQLLTEIVTDIKK